MQLSTFLRRTPLPHPIDLGERTLMVGSCFTEHIGSWLADSWLPVSVNPTGILFNPASIAHALQRWSQAEDASATSAWPLYEREGRYHSFQHHGRFSGTDADATRRVILAAEASGRDALHAANVVMVTWGTAWIYERQGEVVANCHKFPEGDFVRRRLTVDEIVALWTPLLEASPAQRQWIFTVSPIRHVRDTLHGNQLSKATLLLAVEALQEAFPRQVAYLPIYEYFMDELRDYRFYADDLVHPSSLAIEGVRELVQDLAMTSRLRQYMQEAAPIVRAMQHRPSDSTSEQYKAFAQAMEEKRTLLMRRWGIA